MPTVERITIVHFKDTGLGAITLQRIARLDSYAALKNIIIKQVMFNFSNTSIMTFFPFTFLGRVCGVDNSIIVLLIQSLGCPDLEICITPCSMIVYFYLLLVLKL